jgi:hypothetical protein
MTLAELVAIVRGIIKRGEISTVEIEDRIRLSAKKWQVKRCFMKVDVNHSVAKGESSLTLKDLESTGLIAYAVSGAVILDGTTSPPKLSVVSPERFQNIFEDVDTMSDGRPKYISLAQGTLTFGPKANAALTLKVKVKFWVEPSETSSDVIELLGDAIAFDAAAFFLLRNGQYNEYSAWKKEAASAFFDACSMDNSSNVERSFNFSATGLEGQETYDCLKERLHV